MPRIAADLVYWDRPSAITDRKNLASDVTAGSPCRIGAHAVSQDREREAHTALLCTARPQMVRARLQHLLADTGALMRDGACSITPAGEAPQWWALP